MRVKIEASSDSWLRPNNTIEKYPYLNEYGYEDGYINIDTLDEVQDLVYYIGLPLIIFNTEDGWVFEIYDDYRE